MKKILFVCTAAVMLLAGGCYKDDIDDLKDEVNKLKEQMTQYENLLNALNNRLYITDYEVEKTGYVITLSDGSKLNVRNSSDFVAVSLENNVMTFTFGDGKTVQLPVATPEASIAVPEGGFAVDKMQWIRIRPTVKDFEGATFRWMSGETEISAEKDLLHVFDAPGVYRLTFSATNNIGKIELPVTVTVNDAVYVNGVWRVHEYLPAPGQFTNVLPACDDKDTPATATKKAEDALRDGSMICLGAYGGYVVMGFDHTIVNKPGVSDFKVSGNGFPGNAEPGIITVSYDADGNGLPDDEWYEIAGSAHKLPATVRNYEITYYKPNPIGGNVRWTDNRGGEGTVDRNAFHTQASYFPLWNAGDKLTFKGTLLPPNARNTGTAEQPYRVLDAYDWGYADNQSNASEKSDIDIDWAEDKNGNPVHLKGIDFVKVYTGVNQKTDRLGETSTEVFGVVDLHL